MHFNYSFFHSFFHSFSTCCPGRAGDGEYIIYTALAWRNKSYGAAAAFVWGDDSSVFATREGGATVRLFRNFKETAVLKPGFAVEEIYGGALLGVRSADFVCFYDWNTAKVRPRAGPCRSFALFCLLVMKVLLSTRDEGLGFPLLRKVCPAEVSMLAQNNTAAR